MPNIWAGTHMFELWHSACEVSVAEDVPGQILLGVERATEPDHVGLAVVDDLPGLDAGPDATHREHRDRHPSLHLAEQKPIPDRHERTAFPPIHDPAISVKRRRRDGAAVRSRFSSTGWSRVTTARPRD